MTPDRLHVVVPYFNPIRWHSRKKLHAKFEEHMLDSGVALTTIESALGERPHELPDHRHIRRLRVRNKTTLWIKENLINLAFQSLPESWQYAAWVDGDITFRRHNWASETVQALQHYQVVQPWEHAYDLGPSGGHLNVWHAWCRQHHFGHPCGGPRDHPYQHYAHCGYAWAIRRRTFNQLGGLIDVAVLGSADHHMAMAFLGKVKPTTPGGGIHPSYNRHLMAWQERAVKYVGGNIGYVPGTIEHAWHGKKEDRKYVDRWDILRRNKFDPDADVKRNWHGVWELAGNKPQLNADIDKYFRQRNEDGNAN